VRWQEVLHQLLLHLLTPVRLIVVQVAMVVVAVVVIVVVNVKRARDLGIYGEVCGQSGGGDVYCD